MIRSIVAKSCKFTFFSRLNTICFYVMPEFCTIPCKKKKRKISSIVVPNLILHVISSEVGFCTVDVGFENSEFCSSKPPMVVEIKLELLMISQTFIASIWTFGYSGEVVCHLHASICSQALDFVAASDITKCVVILNTHGFIMDENNEID